MIAVDAGDIPGWRPDLRRHQALFDVIRHLGYDAVGVGDSEFVDGIDAFVTALRIHDLPAVSANLRVSSVPEWERLSPPYRIVRAGDLRVGVIGVASASAFDLMLPAHRAALQIDDAETALRRVLPFVKKQADLILVLSHAGLDTDRTLARRVSGIDVIVGSHSQNALHEPVLEGRTLIVQAGSNGSYVGHLHLVLDDDRRIAEYGNRLIALTPDIPDDATVRRRLDVYHEGE